ncbi:hypothetical protein ACWEVD_23325 [Nocardia thailandica]
MVDDVEKRWTGGPAGRGATRYGAAVVVLAAAVFAVVTVWASRRDACAEADTLLCDTPARLTVLIAPSLILLLGALGAFARTLIEWRHDRPWPPWQAAGWFLFLLTTAYAAIGGGTLAT